MNKLKKTDHGEQSLPLDSETNYLIREALDVYMNETRFPVTMRDKALQLKKNLEDPEREDNPTVFMRSHGIIINCPDCLGAGKRRIEPEDKNQEVQFKKCKTCQGAGQLYQEVIRKMYVPTEYHRRKLAK
jgi:hypothetical protein